MNGNGLFTVRFYLCFLHLEEDLSFYVGDSTSDHLKTKSRGQRAEDAPRKHAPQPTRHEPTVFAPGDQVADLSAITKDCVEGIYLMTKINVRS